MTRGIIYPIMGTVFGGTSGLGLACIGVWQACSDPQHDCGSPGLGLFLTAPTFSVIGLLLGGLIGSIVGFFKNRTGKLA